MNSSTRLSFLFSIFLFIVCSKTALAEPGYGPFLPAERVRSVLLLSGQTQSSADRDTDRFVVSITTTDYAHMSLTRRPGAKGADLHLTVGKTGKDVAFPVAEEGAPVLTGVYSVCLNSDDAPDLIITLGYGGCGLMADLTQIVFLLSDGAGRYVMRTHETYDWDANDIVDLNGDGKAQWLQTEFEQVAGPDGRDHPFWLHKLWRFDKTDMTEYAGFKPRRRAFIIL